MRASRELRQLSIHAERWQLAEPFSFASRTYTQSDLIVIDIEQDAARGWGEGSADGADIEPLLAQAHAARAAVAAGADRIELLDLLPAGPVRNAFDCALWDLQAKRSGRPVWQLAELPEPRPLTTAYTIGLDTPLGMGAAAARARNRPLLKLKLDGNDDLERVAAVRANAPAARLIVDANEAWTADHYLGLIDELAKLRVEVIEQPLPAGQDAALRELPRPIAVAADESIHCLEDLEALRGMYDLVNVKLDKTGGLTAALTLARAARSQGFALMVGCMMGTSLAMAPAHLLGAYAAYVDLDAPLLHVADRLLAPLEYRDSIVSPPQPALWG